MPVPMTVPVVMTMSMTVRMLTSSATPGVVLRVVRSVRHVSHDTFSSSQA